LIFSAINLIYGPSFAYFVLAITVLVCPLFILNMFPAIFIISLKRCEDLQLRMDWLKYFPGNKDTVKELELFLWATRNEKFFFGLRNKGDDNVISKLLAGGVYLLTCIGCMSKPKPQDDVITDKDEKGEKGEEAEITEKENTEKKYEEMEDKGREAEDTEDFVGISKHILV
jgi:hypothetical protein